MTTQRRGKITTWKDDKGFGFITPDDGGSPVFFHISSVAKQQPRPAEQMVVVYTPGQDKHQRPCATNVRFITKNAVKKVTVKKNSHPERLSTVIVVGLFFLVLLLVTWIIPLPLWIVALYGVSSIITYGMYTMDKARAQQGAWRISEDTLHLLELVGGWPGALLAQEYQRHKTVKSSYQLVFWFIVGINLLFLIGYSVFLLLR